LDLNRLESSPPCSCWASPTPRASCPVSLQHPRQMRPDRGQLRILIVVRARIATRRPRGAGQNAIRVLGKTSGQAAAMASFLWWVGHKRGQGTLRPPVERAPSTISQTFPLSCSLWPLASSTSVASSHRA
jgi:hypothetical protein